MSETANLLIDEKYQVKSLEKTSDGVEIVEVKPELIVEVATYLKMSKDTRFDVLISVCGVDKLEYFEVVYHLFSTVFNKKLVLKAILNKSNAQIESISSMYSAAEWHERETYDLFGIVFNNHPNLQRLLMPADWKGHPLRKDYVNNDERLSWNAR